MRVRLYIFMLILSLCGATSGSAAECPGRRTRLQNDVEIARGSHVTITNSSGPISVTGTDSATLHVTGRYEDSGNNASVRVDAVRTGGTVEIRPSFDDSGESGEVALDVRLPRYATIDSITNGSGDVSVVGIDGDLQVDCHSGNVRVADVGGVIVKAGSGDVVVEKVKGAAFVEASSGNLTVRDVGGDLSFRAGSGDARVDGAGAGVDATMQSGNLTIHGARGFVRIQAISGDVVVDRAGSGVQVASASGNITLTGVAGDCEAKTASGNVLFTGEISVGHAYRLKSMSGEAVLRLCGNIPGFTVTLRSYSGEIETEFPLKVDRPTTLSRGLTGRYEDGSVQIQIEAFSGSAKILKCQTAPDMDE